MCAVCMCVCVTVPQAGNQVLEAYYKLLVFVVLFDLTLLMLVSLFVFTGH